jgi:hypothetical protein
MFALSFFFDTHCGHILGTQEGIQSLIQSLEAERDQYLKDFGPNRFSFICDIAERVVEQNNQLIKKLESLIGEKMPF